VISRLPLPSPPPANTGIIILFIILAGGGMVFEEKGSKAALFLELFLSVEFSLAQ